MITLAVVIGLTAIVLLLKILAAVTHRDAPDLAAFWEGCLDLLIWLGKAALWLALSAYLALFFYTLFTGG
jgi:hypothetical protein